MSPLPDAESLVEGARLPRASTRWSRIRDEIRHRLLDQALEKLDLRWRFRAVVFAFGLPFLGYIVWAATEQAAIEKGHANDRAKAHAALLAARLEDYVEAVDRLLSAGAQTIGGRTGDPDAVSAALQGMRGHLPRSINNVAVWSLTGANIASLDRRAGLKAVNVADRGYFRQVVDRLDLAIEGPIVSRSSGDRILQFARPVYDANAHLVAVLAMSCRLEDLVNQIDDAGRVSNGALVTIVDRDGVVVARSVDASYWIARPLPMAAEVRQAFLRQAGSRELAGVDGRLRLWGYAATARMPWLVTVGEPIEVAIASVSDRLLKGLAIGLVIFAAALLIAGWAASWTIRPLLRLALDAEQVGRGDLSHRSAVTTGGEIATLAHNFNRMAEALQQRDRALVASEIQLRAITDNIPAQITYVDRDERYRFCNAWRLVFPSMPPESMIGRTVREVRGEHLYAQVADTIKAALGGVAGSFEGTLEHDGASFHYRCSCVPDRDADGVVQGVYAFTEDITERRNAEQRRLESERRLVTITDNLPAMICYVDEERRFRFMNRAYEDWFGRSRAELMERPFTEVLDPRLAREYDHYFLRGMLGETCEYEVEVLIARGETRWMRCSFVPDRPEGGGRIRGVYGMIQDVTSAKVAEQRLTRLAQFDALTGLANRRQFNEQLDESLARRPHADGPLALMFLDIDHFKQVNDRYGHACGDELLREFARRLTDSVRPTDAVARLSGDEFVVLLEHLHTDEEPQFIARKIIASIEKSFVVEDRYLHVGTSIGIALRAFPDETASSLMKRADDALYDAKRSGRNTFRMAG